MQKSTCTACLAKKSTEDVNDQQLHNHLLTWAEWHRADRGDVHGYPSKATGLAVPPPDFDSMADDADCRASEAIETSVYELADRERAAVFCRYLSVHWRFRPMEYEASLSSAMFLLSIKLRKRGVL